ncbi:hemogen isoform X2 [Tachysurus vachellii]|uniref:hemogen isoform X2 n=1 Tax=Tachysurus vachellii TaxID=175792 RepID=UPI00296AF490|nr:hemogen isoform X2 [Tachysurus vachellii]
MEETLEEKVLAEVKVPDDDQGGTGRRLRDRDLLRKRKAEAEERATNQAQSSKRVKRETNNVPRKKGRPRKNVPVKEQQPETTEVQDVGETVTLSQAEEMVPAPPSATVSTLDSVSIPVQAPAPALELPQIPAGVSVQIPLHVPEVTPEIKASSEALLQEVLIEDLGPDEEQDKAVLQDKLVINQGGVEEPSAIDVGEQNKEISDTALASPQPGNLI